MIYIDMSMPEKCSECRFETERGYCKAMPDNFCGNTDDRKRPEWCPLKEQEAQRDYEASVNIAEYCERYEQTYNPEDGSM